MALAKPNQAETWGDQLRRHVGSRGLQPAVRQIHDTYGKLLGVPNTFAKLYALEGPPEDEQEIVRAILLLLTIGQDPREWSIDDTKVPAVWRVENVAEVLTPITACLTVDEIWGQLVLVPDDLSSLGGHLRRVA